MNPGKLNKRVTIQKPAALEDGSVSLGLDFVDGEYGAWQDVDELGQPIESWSEVATVWASVEDLTGREYQAAQSTQNPVQTRIRIRYRAGIQSSMRVLHGTDVYSIQAVLDRDGSKRELQLMCVKGLNNG